MRRDPRLIRYSQEHHAALRLARMLIQVDQGGGDTPAEVSAAIADARDDLERHFAEEERELIPQLRAVGESGLIARLQAEHLALAPLLRSPPAGKPLGHLGRLLEAHVRFEERELFAALQRHWALPAPGGKAHVPPPVSIDRPWGWRPEG